MIQKFYKPRDLVILSTSRLDYGDCYIVSQQVALIMRNISGNTTPTQSDKIIHTGFSVAQFIAQHFKKD